MFGSLLGFSDSEWDAYFDQLRHIQTKLTVPYTTSIVKEGGCLELQVELPGVKREKLEINVTDVGLELACTLRGEKIKWVQPVSAQYDLSRVDAKLTDGLLTVTITPRSANRTRVQVT